VGEIIKLALEVPHKERTTDDMDLQIQSCPI
jgi:hypothetical protein